MSLHEQLVALVETYLAESKKFEEGSMAAAARARKALGAMGKLARERRKRDPGSEECFIEIKLQE